ncbi:SPOR domain-containing protein [Yangia mangrovi]|uniref:SPOR domain-containing protein n=1 Tax=Alloyangia mangrovi TaxID=1779329 RepID=A0ABT2KST5_9RHOB|nr:SPOR domain-containing protein [Alloyangia mangrovi]MCA0940662.1 SPOR domain-containing protein [Alloyangia pacifica]MCA0946008.1 SPOR domain-containing protein [Alloyangia pacifica]MCT4372891.1 SPOR domain-containing protein [Alloyangia mangrovi]
MADYPYDGPEAPAPTGRRAASLANWAGAAVSLALVVGVGMWGYELLMRDVNGIPVVQAMDGPMRIAPEDPGGSTADHIGLAVNAVAGTGLAEPGADRLLLAPQGIGLSDEDMPQKKLAALREKSAQIATASLSQDEALAEIDAEGEEVDPIQALADQIAANARPLGELSSEEGEGELVASVTGAAPAGALIRSLRPSTRPGDLLNQPVALAPAPVEPAGPEEINAETLPAGTRLAQLGAYASEDVARQEWERFSARFGEFMDGKDRVIEKASSGGRTFYRLRAAGFADLADARRFCAAFVSENADCIPVTTR